MAHATASIGVAHYATNLVAGNHALKADEGAELGGQNTGPNPYELLCSALGACTAITLRMYADRKSWPLRAVHVDVRFQRHENESRIKRTLRFEGELDDAQRARLLDISERTPVTLTLKEGVPISTTLM